MSDVDQMEISRILSEIEILKAENSELENKHVTDALTLTVAKDYIRSLLQNDNVAHYLKENHAELFGKFKELVD